MTTYLEFMTLKEEAMDEIRGYKYITDAEICKRAGRDRGTITRLKNGKNLTSNVISDLLKAIEAIKQERLKGEGNETWVTPRDKLQSIRNSLNSIKKESEFKEWLKEVDKEYHNYGGVGSYVEASGDDCWRELYDEGLTPEEAYSEDCNENH